MNRPETTLFLLTSLDGKIDFDGEGILDFDKYIPELEHTNKGFYQYAEIEKQTDLHSMVSGKTMHKMATLFSPEPKVPITIYVVDNTHLTQTDLTWLSKKYEKVKVLTSNIHHCAFKAQKENIEIESFFNTDCENMLIRLKRRYNIERMTIQTGGKLTSAFLRKKLIDHIELVVAPMLVGNALATGVSMGVFPSTLQYTTQLDLKFCEILRESYLHLKYDVIK